MSINTDSVYSDVLLRRKSYVKKRHMRKMRLAFAASIENTETVNIKINNVVDPVTFLIDSGATFTILAKSTADSIGFQGGTPVRQQAVTTVSGQTQAPVYNVTLTIQDTSPFQTEMIVMQSSFNLLSTEDLAKAYSVTLAPGGKGFHLTPLGEAPPTTTPTPPTTTTAPPTTTPVQQQTTTTTTTTKTGNIFIDAMRSLYDLACGGGSFQIPVLCSSPTIFMFMLIMLVIGLIILIASAGG